MTPNDMGNVRQIIDKSYDAGYKDAINEACEWLEKHINDDKYYSCIGEETLIPYLLEDFRKAMEERL